MNKTAIASVLAGAAAIFLGQVAFAAYQSKKTGA